MIFDLDTALRLVRLLVPASLGLIAGQLGMFSKPDEAIATLNLYALHIGFPALLLVGLLDPGLSLPSSPAFYALWPAALLLSLVPIAWYARRPENHAGNMALVLCFGNVAYVGLPYLEAIFGASIRGLAAVAVAIHVCFAVTLGPALLERWSGSTVTPWSTLGARLLRLPLAWTPVLGLSAVMLLAPTSRAHIISWISPVSASAAPVALFMLGLYVHKERRRLAKPRASLLALAWTRLLLAPSAVMLLALAATATGLLDQRSAQLHVVLAAMPAAITTFSIAHRAGVGSEDIAAAIVWTSALSVITLPLWSALARWAL